MLQPFPLPWGWCGTHRGLRLRAVEVGVEERSNVTVTGLQCDGNSVVTILESKGEHAERGLGTGHSVGCQAQRQNLTLSMMEMLQVG